MSCSSARLRVMTASRSLLADVLQPSSTAGGVGVRVTTGVRALTEESCARSEWTARPPYPYIFLCLPSWQLAKTQGNVFATDAILATLMSCTRSVYSWDIVVQRVGSKLFFDKRDNSDFGKKPIGIIINTVGVLLFQSS